MPITYSIDLALRRLFAVATGSLTYSELLAHLEKERDDNGLPLTEIIDATQATVVLSAAEVRMVVQRVRDLGRRNALGPMAIITGDDISFGIMRMMEMLIEDVCDVRPFRNRGKAEEWLDTIPMPRSPSQEE
jgi:hypothetical protein